MIYDIYDRIEEKRKEIEEYIEEKIPLKKYMTLLKHVALTLKIISVVSNLL